MAFLAWMILATVLHSSNVDSASINQDEGKNEEFPSLLGWKKGANGNTLPTVREAIHFSDKRGRMAILSEDRRTAKRENDATYFGVLYPTRPLEDDELFEIKIVENDGTGSDFYFLTFGVTSRNPEEYEQVPDTALDFLTPSWFLFGNSGVEYNGTHWNPMEEINLPRNGKVNDTLGVVKKSNGDINFYFNGDDLGLAKSGVQGKVYAVVDLQMNVGTITIC